MDNDSKQPDSDTGSLVWQGGGVLALALVASGIYYGAVAVLLALVACFGVAMVSIGLEERE